MRSDKKVLDYTKARPHLVVYQETMYVFCGMYLLKYEEWQPDEDELLEYLTNMFFDSEEKHTCEEVDLNEFELPTDWSFSLPETVIQTDYQLGAKGTRNNIARMMDMTFPLTVESHEIDGSMKYDLGLEMRASSIFIVSFNAQISFITRCERKNFR